MSASRASIHTSQYQQGLVLLVLVIVMVLASSSYFFSEVSTTKIRVDQLKKTQVALKKAKRALISYAAIYPEVKTTPTIRGPGYLLCPDTDNDGVAESGCNGPATVGRLPWFSLGVGDLRDSANERLWYAVSQNFDNTSSPAGKKVNTETRGNITVRDVNNILYDGTTMDAVVAVIIAPGEPLTRDDGVVQDRSNANAKINYLDIDTNSGEDNATFTQSTLDGFILGNVYDNAGNVIVNDIIEVITYSDIMQQVHKRVSKNMSNLINDYFTACGAYPEASAFNPDKASFVSPGLGFPNELRRGHLPLDGALPVNWGSACRPAGSVAPPNTAPIPVLWLAEEDWHKLSYYEFAFINPNISSPPAAPAAAGTPCTVAIDCLVVDTAHNVNSLIMFSGRSLAQDLTLVPPLNAQARASANLIDYYEVENNDGDLVFDSTPYNTETPEDFIKIVSP